MKKQLFIASLLLVCAERGFSQYQRSYGTPTVDAGKSITRAADVGYVIAGQTSYQIFGSTDAYVQRTDNNGNLFWGKVYGGALGDGFNSVKRNIFYPNSSTVAYAAAGHSASFSIGAPGSLDAYVVGLDLAGNPLFSRVYGGKETDRAYAIQSIRDAVDGPGFIFVGETNSFGLTGALAGVNVYIVRTDLAGNQKDFAVLGTPFDDRGFSIEQTSDGGYIVAGSTTARASAADNVPNSNILVFKLDASLNIVWSRIIGGPRPVSDVAYSVKEYINGNQRGFIVTGYTENYGAGLSDAFLLNLGIAGNLLWYRTYGGSSAEQGRSVLFTKNTAGAPEFIVTGHSASFSTSYDTYVFKTDFTGNPSWSKIYGGARSEFSYEIIHNHVAGPGYAIVGTTPSFNASGSQDVHLVTTNNVGNALTNCERYIVQSSPRYIPPMTSLLYATPVSGIKYIANQVKQIPLQVLGCVGGGFREEEVAEELLREDLQEVSLQPNPVTGATLFVRLPEAVEEAAVTILDMEGKEVKKINMATNRTGLDVSELQPGIYLMRTELAGGEVKTSKFIKQ